MNCKELATDFEKVRMINSVKRAGDLEQLREITIKLIETNFAMREHFATLLTKGWLSNDK